MNTDNKLVPAAVILSVGLIISVIIFAFTWHSNYLLSQTIAVTGSSTQKLTSDIGYLIAEIKTSAPTARQAYSELQEQKPSVIQFLTENGFTKDQIVFKPPTSYSIQKYDENGRRTGQILSWNYNQRLEVKSNDVALIEQLSLEAGSLVQKGVAIKVLPPEYYYSKLDSLKIEIQAQAAKNAKQRAIQISKATGQDLGRLTNAQMGVLQITPVNSNAVTSLGINDNTSIQKEITGVVSATFQVE